MNLTISAPSINPLNTELNPIYHLLALLEAHHILHVGRIRVNKPKSFRGITLRWFPGKLYGRTMDTCPTG
jgi:hypothetical protein